MDCPKCGKGKMRVVAPVVCSCGHHPLVCDGCCQQFTVPCGEPYGEGALPPDVEMQEDPGHRRAYARLIADIGDKNAPSYEDMTRATLADSPDLFPLLEDFRASLAG
ncbi:MAG TPA: hypothetical protein VL426_04865 [Candidatus Binatia bacterium]|jgi:hypothetical protein|nr:hypothetical protein [Candidatus Binatia bacterium]